MGRVSRPYPIPPKQNGLFTLPNAVLEKLLLSLRLAAARS